MMKSESLCAMYVVSVLLTVLAAAATAADAAEPKSPPLRNEVAAEKLYVSKVKAPKPYPEGLPWKWSDLAPQSIESKNRKLPPWKMGPEGATHPVVLFDPKDIPKIRRRLQRGAGPRIMVHLKRNAERGNIPQSGRYSIITGDESYARKAIPKLIARADGRPSGRWLSNGGQVYDVALGYDLLYNFMTPEQRTKVRNRLDKLAQNIHLHRLSHSEGNWLPHVWGAIGIAGFALQEESNYAESWILRARQANLLYMHNTFDSEGADYEALSRYFAMGMDKVLICFAAERRQGRDFLTYRNNIFNQNVEFMAYMLLPTRRAWVPFDDAFIKDVDNPHSFAAVAALTGDPLAQGLFERICAGNWTWFGNGLVAAAWYDPDVPRENPENSRRLPLARAYGGISGRHMGQWSSGHVFLRTGFDKVSDILFAAQCGDTGGWHGHADQSSFYLYAYGDVLVQDPAISGGYGRPLTEWQKGQEAHSQVLIDGQTTPDYTVGDRRNWPEKYHHGGDVDRFVHTRTLDFVSMDFAEGIALNPKLGGAERAKRYVLFFRHPNREGYFVIIDDVIKDSETHRYEWLLQPDPKHKPVKEGPGRFAFTGRVDLKIRMIEPRDAVYETATFKGYGVNYLRLRSKEDRARGLFLTVLYPKRKDMTVPPITEIREEGLIGATIGEDVVLFNTKLSGPISAAGVKSEGELVALRISGGKVTDAIVLNGKSLTYKGKAVAFEKPEPRKVK